LKCTISALNYIEIHYQYNEVYYKYTQMHWKKIQILWCLSKYIFLPFKIHSYVLIHIRIPSKYITIPSKNLTYFWHILQLLYPSIYFHTRWNWFKTSVFCTSLFCHYTIFQNCHGASLFYQNVLHLPWHVYWNPKMKHIPWIPYILLVN
jgi:hypothetical protein